MTANLRPLLKKGKALEWTNDMEKGFQCIKLLLTTTSRAKPFNPNLNNILITDASRLLTLDLHCYSLSLRQNDLSYHVAWHLSRQHKPDVIQ